MNDYKMYDVAFPYIVSFVLEDEHTEVTIKTKTSEKYFGASIEDVPKQKEMSDKHSVGTWAKYMVNHLREKLYDLDINDVVVVVELADADNTVIVPLIVEEAVASLVGANISSIE